MSVRQVLDRKGDRRVTASCKSAVSDIVHILAGEGIGTVMLTGEDGSLAGIFSERDLVEAMSCFGAETFRMPVQELMTTPVVTCEPDTSLNGVLALMSSHGIRHLPVMEEDRP